MSDDVGVVRLFWDVVGFFFLEGGVSWGFFLVCYIWS